MNTRLSRIVLGWGAPVVLGAIAALVGSRCLPESIASQAARQAAIVPPVRFTTVTLSLAPGDATFPPGKGAEIANANCVMCHSTGMVLRQPPLAVDEWRTEIMKMHDAFGAPIPLDQVDALAQYLGTVNGRKPQKGPSGVDSQAS